MIKIDKMGFIGDNTLSPINPIFVLTGISETARCSVLIFVKGSRPSFVRVRTLCARSICCYRKRTCNARPCLTLIQAPTGARRFYKESFPFPHRLYQAHLFFRGISSAFPMASRYRTEFYPLHAFL